MVLDGNFGALDFDFSVLTFLDTDMVDLGLLVGIIGLIAVTDKLGLSLATC